MANGKKIALPTQQEIISNMYDEAFALDSIDYIDALSKVLKEQRDDKFTTALVTNNFEAYDIGGELNPINQSSILKKAEDVVDLENQRAELVANLKDLKVPLSLWIIPKPFLYLQRFLSQHSRCFLNHQQHFYIFQTPLDVDF